MKTESTQQDFENSKISNNYYMTKNKNNNWKSFNENQIFHQKKNSLNIYDNLKKDGLKK